MRLLLMGALLGVCAGAFAQCPGPDCPPKDSKARASSVKCPGPGCPEKYEKPKIEMVAEKCPGPGCPEKQNKTAAKTAKKADKQDWGHFSSGAKKDQKAMEKKKAADKKKAAKGTESSGG